MLTEGSRGWDGQGDHPPLLHAKRSFPWMRRTFTRDGRLFQREVACSRLITGQPTRRHLRRTLHAGLAASLSPTADSVVFPAPR